jgi:hypothetical protein
LSTKQLARLLKVKAVSRSEPERLLNTVEAAKRLGVHAGTLMNWRWLGVGPKFQKDPKKGWVYYRESDLNEYEQSRERSAV